MVQQRARVGRLAVPHGQAAGGNDLGKQRVLQGGAGQQRHIVGGGVVVLGIQAAGGDKMGVVHAQRSGPAVHLPGKLRKAAAQAHGGGAGGVVAAGKQHPDRQRVQRDGIPLLQSHAGAFRQDGGIVHRKFLLQVLPFQRQQRGHDLGGAGHRELLVDILRKQHLAALRFHHDGGRSAHPVVLAGDQALRGGGLRQQGGRQQDGRGLFFHQWTPPRYPFIVCSGRKGVCKSGRGFPSAAGSNGYSSSVSSQSTT